jgi:hypothetical protein
MLPLPFLLRVDARGIVFQTVILLAESDLRAEATGCGALPAIVTSSFYAWSEDAGSSEPPPGANA